MQRIGDNPFATADLRGKLLNICTDLPSQRLDDSGDFKAIVSGETIRAERKHQPAFHFVPYCRLLYSANNLPESVDTCLRATSGGGTSCRSTGTFDVGRPGAGARARC